jgi:hypothetical protein
MPTPHLFPSPSLRGITPFAFTTPEGWSAAESDRSLVAITPDDGEEGTELHVSWRRVPDGSNLAGIGRRARALLESSVPGVRITLSRIGRLNGRSAHIRIAEFTPPADEGDEPGPLLAQLYVCFFGPADGSPRPLELFEITGICHATNAHRIRDFNAVVESFRFLLLDPTLDERVAANTAVGSDG